jgi:NO-binding membrane sensor protein with MHYT domain
MKQHSTLVITNLLTIVLVTLHLTDDIVRGVSPSGLTLLTAVGVLVVWLYGVLVLGERRSGYVIMLIGSIIGTGIPILHMAGRGIVTASAPLFVWTDLAVCTSGAFGVVLAIRALWGARGSNVPAASR